jgi:hypothetical protein
MRTHLPEAYLLDSHLASLEASMPDPDDLHVVRAALAVEGAVVTFNLGDFPGDLMGALAIAVLTPDDAILDLAAADEEGVLTAAHAIRGRLKAPSVSAEAFAAGFAKAGCPKISDCSEIGCLGSKCIEPKGVRDPRQL